MIVNTECSGFFFACDKSRRRQDKDVAFLAASSIVKTSSYVSFIGFFFDR